MQIILAAATDLEISTTVQWLEAYGVHEVKVLITGVGSAVTAWSLTNAIFHDRPGLIIQAGIGGSFSDGPAPGSVNFVHEEVFADTGVSNGNKWNDVFDLGLADPDGKPFKSGLLINHYSDSWKKFDLPFFRGATVSRISSTAEEAQLIKSKYETAIESMEGAALHYVCLQENMPFMQIRAISNYAGERDKSKWKMKEAIEALNANVKTIIPDLINEMAKP